MNELESRKRRGVPFAMRDNMPLQSLDGANMEIIDEIRLVSNNSLSKRNSSRRSQWLHILFAWPVSMTSRQYLSLFVCTVNGPGLDQNHPLKLRTPVILTNPIPTGFGSKCLDFRPAANQHTYSSSSCAVSLTLVTWILWNYIDYGGNAW